MILSKVLKLKKISANIKYKNFLKKPIAIVFHKKIFYLSEKIELIELFTEEKFIDLPYVIGDHKKFKILYKDLKMLNFPIYLVKRFVLYEANRCDIETKNDEIIKLPSSIKIVLKNTWILEPRMNLASIRFLT